MAFRLRAEYINELLKPLEPLEPQEPLDLQEGTVVMVTIEEEESILDLFDRLRNSVPEEEWERPESPRRLPPQHTPGVFKSVSGRGRPPKPSNPAWLKRGEVRGRY